MSKEFRYVGHELSIFRNAHNWKNYFGKHLRPFLTGDVLEVGAGIGATTEHLFNPDCRSWTCLEPDAGMCRDLERVINDNKFGERCAVVCGTLGAMPVERLYDSIIYIDVLEHIEHDREELEHAFRHLKAGGKLVVLSPAYMYLYTEFDKAIGHYRRYTSKTLLNVFPRNMKVVMNKYLDGFGVMTSLANKWFLKQNYPTASQARLWDNYIVPVSKVFDPIFGFSFGRSIIIVAEKV